jgi:hypothetical protein
MPASLPSFLSTYPPFANSPKATHRFWKRCLFFFGGNVVEFLPNIFECLFTSDTSVSGRSNHMLGSSLSFFQRLFNGCLGFVLWIRSAFPNCS